MPQILRKRTRWIFNVGCVAAVAGAWPTGSFAQAREGVIATTDGVHLHYDVRGNGRDTLIVLHGGPGLSSSYFGPDLDILSNYTLIFYDQRGAGRSTVVTDSTRLRVADHVRDLDAVRQHFRIERASLLGHSWGTGLAVFYALAHEQHVARMILASSIPARRSPWMQMFGQNLRSWMDSATASRFAALTLARRGAADPVAACRAYWRVFIRGYFSTPADSTQPERMRGDVCNAPPDAIRNNGLVNTSTLGPLGDWDWRNMFAQLRIPVLVVHGDKDAIPVASAGEWQAAFTGARLVIIKDAGHFPYVEQPDAFRRALDAFLRGA